ncbi:MAG: hypothetical protein MUO88_03950 [Desulfobacterales bacterium]|nr:hypothetical protein [Desulfobacterales bacterium]
MGGRFWPESTLHSEQEEIEKITFSNAIEQIAQLPTEDIEEASNRLLGILGDITVEDENWQIDLSKIRQFKSVITTEKMSPLIMRSMLNSFIRKHIGAYLLWLPKSS